MPKIKSSQRGHSRLQDQNTEEEVSAVHGIQCHLINGKVPRDVNVRDERISILQTNDFKDKRARAMDVDDLLRLLYAFNAKGIHFV